MTHDTHGRISTDMAEPDPEHTRITPDQLQRLIDRQCDPKRVGSFAARIDMFLHSPEASRQIAEDYVTRAAAAAITKADRTPDATPSVKWVANHLTHCLGLERWAQSLGFPATYWRAGGRYLKAVQAWKTTHGGREPSEDDRQRIWDETALAFAATHPHNRYVRLTDGSSSCPTGRRRPDPDNNGLAHYRACLEDMKARARTLAAHSTGIEEERDTAASTTITPADGQIDADWLRDHGINRDQLAAFTPSNLLDMGLDPRAVADAARHLDDTSAASTPTRVRPRPMTVVRTRLPLPMAVRLAAVAHDRNTSVSELLRTFVTEALDREAQPA